MQGGLICSFLVVLPSIFLIINGLGHASQVSTSSADAKEDVYIVFVSEQHPEGVDPDTYYAKFLSPILGSEKAAKDALVYAYTIIAGFAAKLNPYQVELLKKQPGVLEVVKDTTIGPIDEINA